MAVLAIALIAAPALAGTDGTISDVIVYRGQALVTRAVDFEAKAGPQEVVVSNLPNAVVPDSLYAASEGGVTIRAVRYRAAAVK